MTVNATIPIPPRQDSTEDFFVDDAVAKFFPKGSKLVSAHPHGGSFWTRLARIELQLSDQSTLLYCLKVASDALGLAMVRGEFYGMGALHQMIPEESPGPIGWGTYVSDSNTHFYLMEWVEMDTKNPVNKAEVCRTLATLHRTSQQAPDNPGRCGFPVQTCSGAMYQDVTWSDTWEQAFAKLLEIYMEQERSVNGRSAELDADMHALQEKVVPRLLRPLRTHGREFRPALIHGDLWPGNMATNLDTGKVTIFDASVYWGHNEIDLMCLPIPRYGLGMDWVEEYLTHIPKSEPVEDFQDRLALYAIKANLLVSTLFTSNPSYRQFAIDSIREMVDKYPDGYQGE